MGTHSDSWGPGLTCCTRQQPCTPISAPLCFTSPPPLLSALKPRVTQPQGTTPHGRTPRSSQDGPSGASWLPHLPSSPQLSPSPLLPVQHLCLPPHQRPRTPCAPASRPHLLHPTDSSLPSCRAQFKDSSFKELPLIFLHTHIQCAPDYYQTHGLFRTPTGAFVNRNQLAALPELAL